MFHRRLFAYSYVNLKVKITLKEGDNMNYYLPGFLSTEKSFRLFIFLAGERQVLTGALSFLSWS